MKLEEPEEQAVVEEQQERAHDSCSLAEYCRQMIDVHDAGLCSQACGEGYQRRGDQETP